MGRIQKAVAYRRPDSHFQDFQCHHEHRHPIIRRPSRRSRTRFYFNSQQCDCGLQLGPPGKIYVHEISRYIKNFFQKIE